MIYSEDIRRNEKLPNFIKDHRAFRGDKKYLKVFPKIGLDNFEIKLSKTKHGFFSGFKKILFNIDAVLSGETEESVSKRLKWKILFPIYAYTHNLIKLIKYYLYRRDNKLEIVFSSDYTDGALDVTTMSERGISNGAKSNNFYPLWRWLDYPYHLVGSIIDPCCGIIYLTDGVSTNFGSNMLHCAMVRYVVHRHYGPCILLEELLCNKKSTLDVNVIEFIFVNEIRKRCSLPVISNFFYSSKNLRLQDIFFIPRAPAVLKHFVDASCRTSHLEYLPLTEKDYRKFPSLKTVRNQIQQPE